MKLGVLRQWNYNFSVSTGAVNKVKYHFLAGTKHYLNNRYVYLHSFFPPGQCLNFLSMEEPLAYANKTQQRDSE